MNEKLKFEIKGIISFFRSSSVQNGIDSTASNRGIMKALLEPL